jgi:hypothetical protein
MTGWGGCLCYRPGACSTPRVAFPVHIRQLLHRDATITVQQLPSAPSWASPPPAVVARSESASDVAISHSPRSSHVMRSPRPAYARLAMTGGGVSLSGLFHNPALLLCQAIEFVHQPMALPLRGCLVYVTLVVLAGPVGVQIPVEPLDELNDLFGSWHVLRPSHSLHHTRYYTPSVRLFQPPFDAECGTAPKSPGTLQKPSGSAILELRDYDDSLGGVSDVGSF